MARGMATQIAIGARTDTHSAHTTTDEQTLAAPDAMTADATAGALRGHEGPGMTESPATRVTQALASVPPSTIAFVSLATVGVATVFAFGLNYRRSTLALRRMAADALEIRIPVLLPVTLAAFARAIMANRRAESSVDDAFRHAR